MPWFRNPASTPASSVNEVELRRIIETAIRPGQFFVAPSLNLIWDYQAHETTYWELFRGQAMDHTQTRRQQSFEVWAIREQNGGSQTEPLLAVRLDLPANAIHVTRSIACHAFESYSEGNAILSRETIRRSRELVGSIDLNRLVTAAEIEDELIALIYFALVGTSRLPLTSIEAPLPQFTFGQLGYCWRCNAGTEPFRAIDEWLIAARTSEISRAEKSRLLETMLRAATSEQVPALAESLIARRIQIGGAPSEISGLFREMFNNVALSPYTDFVHKALKFLRCLVAPAWITEADEADILTHLLRQLGRHLTSFDLIRFHHRGANYPDALLLDEVISRVLEILQQSPRLFLADGADNAASAKQKRLRRRGLRSAWLIRRQYQGHPVPDAPTSPGENARVLPRQFSPVPEEQILHLGKRSRRLFLDSRFETTPQIHEALRLSIADLVDQNESIELGIGLFLDRPFGFAKPIGEPDRTTLLSHEAFSLQIARFRLNLLAEIGQVPEINFQSVPGIPSRNLGSGQPPGVASVRDAQLAAEDFVFLRTTRRSVGDLLQAYDFSPLRESGILAWLQSDRCLILPSNDSPADLLIYDSHGLERLRLRMDASLGYRCRAGIEALAAGLSVVSARNQTREIVSDLAKLRLPSQM